MARQFHLSDAEWAKIEPLLATRKAGRRRVDDRATVAGIVLSLRTGCPWRELPAIYGNTNTLMSRFRRWQQDGTIDKIAAVLRFTPMSASERHHLQGYGAIQRQQFKRDGVNPWLRTEAATTGQEEDPLEELARLSGWDRR